MKNIFSKRVLSLLLALVLTLGMFPMSTLTAFAEEINLELGETVLTKGRPVEGKEIYVQYTADGEAEVAAQEKYPVGTDVSEWFSNLPGNISAYIDEYYGGNKIAILLAGVPDFAAPFYKYDLLVPASFYLDGVAKTFHGNIKVEQLSLACSGCTLKTINGFQVCYKEGKGIHVCETNFGYSADDVGANWDKSPEDGYISPEEEPSKMDDSKAYWYYFDIEEVYIRNGIAEEVLYLDSFPNLRKVELLDVTPDSHESLDAVIRFGEKNANLESIDLIDDYYKSAQRYAIVGLDNVPASAPLQKVEVKLSFVDRIDWNFPTLEKLVLKDSVIDGEAEDQIFITKACAALKHIDLNGTDLSHNGSDSNISYDLANLEYLDVSKTGIQKINIAHYSKLKYFYATDNGLTEIIGARGEGGRTLADKCPNLVEVDVSGNNLTEFVVGQHNALKKLDLSNNDFAVYSLANVPAIEEFHINQANEAGVYDNKLQTLYVIDCPNLKVLDAGYQMNANFALALDGLPALEELDLTECRALTDLPLAVKNSVEILKVDNCTNWDIIFSGDEFKNLRILHAKNVTCPDAGGTKCFAATAPTIEVVYYEGSKGVTHISLTSPKLKYFALEGCDSLTAVDVSGASSLKELYLGKNKNLETLTLDDNFSLETIDIHVDDTDGVSKITSLDMSDCYSLVKVGVSKDAEKIRILYPWQPDNPEIQMIGWRYKDCYGDWDNGSNDIYFENKFSDDFGDHGCNHYKGQDDDEGSWWWPDCCTVGSDFTWMHFPGQVDDNDYDKEYRYRTWNFTRWKVGGSDSEKTAYKAVFNFSPYKEDSRTIESTYYVTALNASWSDIPGLVGWADKKFATEEEILYYPGEQFVLSKDIELYPVYNTKTQVDYYVGNYGNDIIVDEEAVKALGLEDGDNGYYRTTVYEKSSLSDYWTYEVLDFVPSWEGYIFQGWKYATASDVFVYQPGDKIELEGDKSITLSAKWEKKVDMPSAYTYLSCDDPYFEKGHTVSLTAKVVGLGGADLSETNFKAFLYLYEEGKEHEKVEVTERTFTGDEVTFGFTYPADDTRIAYVEIYRYEGGNYSQKCITDDYVLTPAKEMDVEFLYSIGDGYVPVTKDTTITLPQGANDGWLDIEVDALGGKGNLNIRLYEINSNVTVGTEIDNVVSTNTIGTKNYRARVSDETGNIIFTDKLTVTIVPLLEILSESEDSFKIARNQEVVFSVDYKGYVGYDGEFLDELYIKEWDDDANAYIEVPGAEIVVNAKNTTSGTISFVIPVSAPASGDYEYHRYYVYIEDQFGNDYEHDVEVEFDRTSPLTFAVDGRGTIKFYDYYNGADYAGVFANGTDVAAELDGGWVYDITDKLYDSKRAQYPDNVLVPTLGTDVSVEVKLYRYESYEAYKADRYTYENAYESKFSAAEFDSSYYVDITNAYASNEGRIPGTVNYLGAMAPGYYTMTLYISNRNGLDLTGTNSFVAEGGFEVLATGAEHVHDYKAKTGVGDPHIHTYECICGDSYTENHVFPAEYPVDGQWRENGVSVWNDEGTATIYKPTNAEYLICSACGDTVYRWRFIESFTIGNADLQEGKTDAYEKTMAVDQTLELAAMLDFLEELNPELASTNAYKNLSKKLDDFWPNNTKINWTSSNQDVAIVDENGVVTTVGEGTALITGTTVQPGKATGEPMTVTILINVNCKHLNHKVKVPAQEPTCQADGHIEHYMCLDCTKYSLTGDFTDTVSYENDIKLAKVDHAKLYGVWHSDANGHWRECKYGCGTRYDEGTHYSTEAANCQHPEYCATCNYVLAPVTDHSHDKYGWSEGYHWSICECGVVVEGSNEVHQFGADGSSDTCDDCGYKKNVGYTVSGTITSYLKAEGDITVQLLSGEEVAYSQVFNTYTEVNASRKEYSTVYSIPAVVDGTYTLRISKVNHVTRDYTVTVNGGVLTQDVKIHLLGDVTGDGKINALDKKKIYNHINGDLLTGYEFDVANVKADTKINALDKKMIYNHINGESLWE